MLGSLSGRVLIFHLAASEPHRGQMRQSDSDCKRLRKRACVRAQ
jgi:hypothetical protein